ncbi:MAG TPA: hypothetical protein VGP17_05390 [Solirubrobacteraceae bacterium]|jgi:hypothetical protein|nr:hypothetical protein [Solirubrobacteraceae bacterium]
MASPSRFLLQGQSGSVNMQRTRVGFLVAAAALALSGVLAGTAGAEEFVASKTGKLTDTALETQVFKTKAGSISCTKLKGTGTVSETTTETQTTSIQYEDCTAFGIISASISLAEYLFMANGEVKILKTIEIKAPGCEITVPAQTVSSVAYKNRGVGIEIVPSVTKIESEGKGSFCAYAKEKEGTYKGTAFTELEGGEIQVGNNDNVTGEPAGAGELVGPGKPFTFGAGEKARHLILRNPGALRRQFLNETAEHIPGVLAVNEGGNFGLKEVKGAEQCGEILAGGARCEIEITSAAGGKKGEYKLEYGNAANPIELKFEIKS